MVALTVSRLATMNERKGGLPAPGWVDVRSLRLGPGGRTTEVRPKMLRHALMMLAVFAPDSTV